MRAPLSSEARWCSLKHCKLERDSGKKMDASDRKYPGRSFLGLRCKSLGRVVLFFLAQKRAVSRPSRYVPEDSVPDPYHYPKTAAPRLPFGPTTSPIIESYPLELIENHAFAQQIRNLEIRLARYTSSDHYHHHQHWPLLREDPGHGHHCHGVHDCHPVHLQWVLLYLLVNDLIVSLFWYRKG